MRRIYNQICLLQEAKTMHGPGSGLKCRCKSRVQAYALGLGSEFGVSRLSQGFRLDCKLRNYILDTIERLTAWLKLKVV